MSTENREKRRVHQQREEEAEQRTEQVCEVVDPVALAPSHVGRVADVE